jgi:CRP/FNR family transcriptional regulator
VLFLDREAFEFLYLHDPEIARAVIRDLGRRLRRLISLLEKVSLHGVPARVAATVLERAEAAGVLADGGAFTLGATQEKLARMLATTREGVARALAELRRRKIIEQTGPTLRVLDPQRLAARARGEAA